MYKFRDATFAVAGDGEKFLVANKDSCKSYDNPREAIVAFAAQVESILINELMTKLEGKYDRWTGEKIWANANSRTE